MSRMRQTIAKRLVSAKNNTAMLTTFNEVDMTAVMALREKYQDKFVKKYGVKLGFMSIFGKACAKVPTGQSQVSPGHATIGSAALGRGRHRLWSPEGAALCRSNE